MSLENPHIIRQLGPFEDIKQKRLFPMRAARVHLSGTTPPASSQSSIKFTTSDSCPFTDPEREDKLGLDGIVIDWMVDTANKMRTQSSPYGLVYSESGFNGNFSDENMKVVQDANLLGDPFATFSFAIRHTLAHALKTKLKDIFATPEGHEAAIYRKYMEYAHRSGNNADDTDGIKYTVSSSNTVLRIMGDVLQHAADIDPTSLGRKPTIDESANAARNSTPLIIKLSSFEQTVFDVIQRSMSEGGRIWKSLIIVENEGEMFYQIKDPVLRHAIDQLSHPDTKGKVEKKSRGGCPARMRFEGKESAIETLWNWYIDYSILVSQIENTKK